MERLKYLFALLLLAAIHFLLSGLPLVCACLVLGAALYPWFRTTSYFLLRILAMEILLALVFWLLVWRPSNGLGSLILNSDFSAAYWIGAAAVVNIVTATLCTSVSFYLVRAFGRRRKLTAI
jgi:hypothetical protein